MNLKPRVAVLTLASLFLPGGALAATLFEVIRLAPDFSPEWLPPSEVLRSPSSVVQVGMTETADGSARKADTGAESGSGH